MTDQNSIQVQSSESNGASGAVEDIVETLSEGEGSFVVDEKKTLNRSTIVTFVVLVIGAAGVWFMYQRTGPKAASAADSAKETIEAKKTINGFLSGGEASIKLMESMLKNTQKVVEQFLSYPSMTQVPLSDLQTNPFRVKPLTPTAGPDYEGMDRKRREEERLAALKNVQNLQLQSIMHSGSRKGCMINGGLYVEGQTVENFVIEQINPTVVVVRSGQYRFELSMQR